MCLDIHITFSNSFRSIDGYGQRKVKVRFDGREVAIGLEFVEESGYWCGECYSDNNQVREFMADIFEPRLRDAKDSVRDLLPVYPHIVATLLAELEGEQQ